MENERFVRNVRHRFDLLVPGRNRVDNLLIGEGRKGKMMRREPKVCCGCGRTLPPHILTESIGYKIYCIPCADELWECIHNEIKNKRAVINLDKENLK